MYRHGFDLHLGYSFQLCFVFFVFCRCKPQLNFLLPDSSTIHERQHRPLHADVRFLTFRTVRARVSELALRGSRAVQISGHTNWVPDVSGPARRSRSLCFIFANLLVVIYLKHGVGSHNRTLITMHHYSRNTSIRWVAVFHPLRESVPPIPPLLPVARPRDWQFFLQYLSLGPNHPMEWGQCCEQRYFAYRRQDTDRYLEN